MSNSKLPERASLEFLRKLANRLRTLRKTDPGALDRRMSRFDADDAAALRDEPQAS
jgi:hypothetical protein